jgi:hypothetical protein
MTKKGIEKVFTVKNGVIKDPGKFEAEPVYSPYFYDLCMESAGDDHYSPDGKVYSFFVITKDEKKEFSELNGIYGVVCHESDTGFWNCESYNNKNDYLMDIRDMDNEAGENY